MKHESNKQLIYRIAQEMEGEFTAYDILYACGRDISVQSISCTIRGIPGAVKVVDRRGQGVSTWQIV